MTKMTHPPDGWTVMTAAGPQLVFCRADDSSAAAAEAMAWGEFGAPLPPADDLDVPDEV